MPDRPTSPAASEAARNLARLRWDKTTEPGERKAATAPALAARLKKAAERKAAAARPENPGGAA